MDRPPRPRALAKKPLLIAAVAVLALGLGGGVALGVRAANAAEAERVAAQALADAQAALTAAESERATAAAAHDGALESARAEHARGAALLDAADTEMLADAATHSALDAALLQLAVLLDSADSASTPGTGSPSPSDNASATALSAESADLVRRTKALGEGGEAVRAAAIALVASAHAKAVSLTVPGRASTESSDAFVSAAAELAAPADDADLAALVVRYQDAWRTAVESDRTAAAALYPAPGTGTGGGAGQPTYIGGILIVNKTYPLPSWYGNGLTPELVGAFNAMRAAAAAEQGLDLWIVSGFRSYATQVSTYNYFVANYGQAYADTTSARPGHSEHQSGLAIDVNLVDQSFGSTTVGMWVAANAHRFGFVVRYPQGKEHITGYMYEPWHLRYLGSELAATLYSSGLTLEEYLGITSQYDY